MVWVVKATPRPLYPREWPATQGWVGPRPGLDGCGKISPPQGFDPQTVQPVASYYTNYTVQAHAVPSDTGNIFLISQDSVSLKCYINR